MVNVDPKITARTARLFIRPLSMDDLEGVHKLRSTPEVAMHSSHKTFENIEQSRAWLQGCLDAPNCWDFGVELLPSDAPGDTAVSRFIGAMGAIRAPEFGYMLHVDHWGKGYATEALEAILQLFFDHFSGGENPRYDYAEARTDSENKRSQNVLLKTGFVLVERREKDFESPMLGLRDTWVFRKYRPGGAGETS